MKRYAGIIEIKKGNFEQYKKLHANVWPQVLSIIKKCNIQNYSIYYKNGLMFSYYEYTGNSYDSDMAKMAADIKTQQWWSLVKPLMEPVENRNKGEFWAEMEEIFHWE